MDFSALYEEPKTEEPKSDSYNRELVQEYMILKSSIPAKKWMVCC